MISRTFTPFDVTSVAYCTAHPSEPASRLTPPPRLPCHAMRNGQPASKHSLETSIPYYNYILSRLSYSNSLITHVTISLLTNTDHDCSCIPHSIINTSSAISEPIPTQQGKAGHTSDQSIYVCTYGRKGLLQYSFCFCLP